MSSAEHGREIQVLHETMVTKLAELEKMVKELRPRELNAASAPGTLGLEGIPASLSKDVLEGLAAILRQRAAEGERKRQQAQLRAGARTLRRIGKGSFALAGLTLGGLIAALFASQVTALGGAIIGLSGLFLALAGELLHSHADSLHPGSSDD